MDKNEYKKLIHYTNPRRHYLIGGILMTIVGAVVTYGSFISGDPVGIVAGVIFTLLLGITLIALSVSQRHKYKKKLESIMDSSKSARLLADFQNGKRAFGDKLILGDVYIMGKRSGVIREYGELVRIYQWIPNNVCIGKEPRYLSVETAFERKLDLCAIPGRGKDDEELKRVIETVTSKNNGIAVGFIGR